MRCYQATKKTCRFAPQILVFVDEGLVVGHQLNPKDPQTQQWAPDGHYWFAWKEQDWEDIKRIA